MPILHFKNPIHVLTVLIAVTTAAPTYALTCDGQPPAMRAAFWEHMTHNDFETLIVFGRLTAPNDNQPIWQSRDKLHPVEPAPDQIVVGLDAFTNLILTGVTHDGSTFATPFQQSIEYQLDFYYSDDRPIRSREDINFDELGWFTEGSIFLLARQHETEQWKIRVAIMMCATYHIIDPSDLVIAEVSECLANPASYCIRLWANGDREFADR